jgi:hypothetical protein
MAILTGLEFEQLQQPQSASSLSNMRSAAVLCARYFYLTSAVQMQTFPLLVVNAISSSGEFFGRSEERTLQFDSADTM